MDINSRRQLEQELQELEQEAKKQPLQRNEVTTIDLQTRFIKLMQTAYATLIRTDAKQRDYDLYFYTLDRIAEIRKDFNI